MAPTPAYVPPKGIRTHLEDFIDFVNNKYNAKIGM